ncbi:MAG: hypothetical protein WCC40_04130 [Rhodomicrobium sp.]
MRISEKLARLFWTFFLVPFGLCFAEPSLDPPPSDNEKLFLDRLMLAESGGRLFARNPRSGAYGPFQFLSQTFLDIVKRNLPAVAEGKTDAQLLELRATADVARDAALIYTRENASFLTAHNAPVTGANLRLAFFVGPGAALKVLAAKPEEPLSNILSPAAVAANPMFSRMTAAALIEKSSRDAEGVGSQFSAAPLSSPGTLAKAAKSNIDVRCNLKLASCRKWLALAEKRMGRRRIVLGPESGQASVNPVSRPAPRLSRGRAKTLAVPETSSSKL